MAKMYGYSGKVTGKKGDNVFSVRNGDQIIRQYNPIVANPSTPSQVEARAKLKLVSQLGAVLANVIAIPREGSKSPRNLFSSINYGYTNYADNASDIQLSKVQLTKSNRGMEDFNVTRASGTNIVCELNANANYSRVVYVVVTKNTKGELKVFDSVTVENSGTVGGSTFEGTLKYSDEACAVYAYGITELNGTLSALQRDARKVVKSTFDNLVSPTAEDVAKLITTSKLSVADLQVTKTNGVYMEVGTTTADSSNFKYATIRVSVVGSGTVSGAGRYPVGTVVTLTASPSTGASFIGWYVDNTQVSTSASYQVSVEDDVNIEARFTVVQFTVAVSADPVGGGTVSGAGTFDGGSSVTVNATNKAGYVFVNWTKNGTQVSTSAAYTFTLNDNTTLVANFEAVPTHLVSLEVDPSQSGTVKGAGNYPEGSTVICEATPAAGYAFVKWQRQNGANWEDIQGATTDRYEFTMASAAVTLRAVFELASQGDATVVVSTDAGNTTASGGGVISWDDQITLTTSQTGSGLQFMGWQYQDPSNNTWVNLNLYNQSQTVAIDQATWENRQFANGEIRIRAHWESMD